jgi:hypothetical protein
LHALILGILHSRPGIGFLKSSFGKSYGPQSRWGHLQQ